MYKKTKQVMNKVYIALALWSIAWSCQAGIIIDPGGGMFSKLTVIMQDYVNFMTGAFSKTVVVSSLVLGMAVWAIGPSEGLAAIVLRVLVTGVILANMEIVVNALSL